MKPINRKLVMVAKLLAPIWWFLGVFSRTVRTTDKPKTILVFDFHLIGDIVMLTPLLRCLKSAYPHANLVLVAGPWAKDILYGTKLVDEIIPFNAPWVKYGQGLRGVVACFELLKTCLLYTSDAADE